MRALCAFLLISLLFCHYGANGFTTTTSSSGIPHVSPWRPSRSENDRMKAASWSFSHPYANTLLKMSSPVEPEEENGATFNLALIGQTVLNQAVIGSTIWTGGAGYQTLAQYANFDSAWLLGILGLVPLLLVSRKVERSESPVFAGINLSTNMAVLRLFGDAPQPIPAFLVSVLLGTITGIVEETTFRGQLLPSLSQWATTSLGMDNGLLFGFIGSTVIFALLHTNPLAFLKGGDSFLDNAVLLVFQLVTGSIFALLYLTTQNLAVPIVAHALYDFYTFFKTHLDVTRQMEYAMAEKLLPSTAFAVERKWSSLRGENFVQSARETFYLMDTNKDGVLSRKELRVALFSYGINLSKMQSEKVAREADLDQSGAIDLGEFLEFVGPEGSTRKAVRNAILGPI